jgi:hypothetical protein
MKPHRVVTAGLLTIAATGFAAVLGLPAFLLSAWDGGASLWLLATFVVFLCALAFFPGVRSSANKS